MASGPVLRRALILLWCTTGALYFSAAVGAAQGSARRAAAPAPVSSTYRSVYNGWKWWHVYCYRCHGVNATGSPTAPNIADPNLELSPSAFFTVVSKGIPDKGMQAWDKLLDRKQIGEIHLYVRARADKVLPPGRPDEVGPKGGQWVPPAGWPK
jgi:mono/diheme cytochrome c family protein